MKENETTKAAYFTCDGGQHIYKGYYVDLDGTLRTTSYNICRPFFDVMISGEILSDMMAKREYRIDNWNYNIEDHSFVVVYTDDEHVNPSHTSTCLGAPIQLQNHEGKQELLYDIGYADQWNWQEVSHL